MREIRTRHRREWKRNVGIEPSGDTWTDSWCVCVCNWLSFNMSLAEQSVVIEKRKGGRCWEGVSMVRYKFGRDASFALPSSTNWKKKGAEWNWPHTESWDAKQRELDGWRGSRTGRFREKKRYPACVRGSDWSCGQICGWCPQHLQPISWGLMYRLLSRIWGFDRPQSWLDRVCVIQSSHISLSIILRGWG